ncbi:diversity-generating retroelement protein Avd [Shinella sp. BYT-45]|uniref:diversity-generating retroelement protein Avd n=1 Tax=Shinella sp. BYT-45 TaxID=3377377 RepID=UPI00397F2E20
MKRDHNVNPRDLAIVEKYGAAVNYLYPILQSFPRRHGALRDEIVGKLMGAVDLLYHAAKSRQLSRLHAADAHLAALRFRLRFACDCRLLSPRQLSVALGHIYETGAMLGAWLRDAKGNGRSGQ